jgi:uncharacterized protein YcgL (UPF0745 family)
LTEQQASLSQSTSARVEVSVYRSLKKAQTYVYLPSDQDYESLPEALIEQFGDAVLFLTFELHEKKKLAQVEAKSVLAALRNQGFFLQLPPLSPQSSHD